MSSDGEIWKYNWAEELCSLFESQKNEVGKMRYKEYQTEKGEERSYYVLLPPFHTTVKAQITVTIAEDGTFLTAEQVDRQNNLTIIPVTEKSAGRTSHAEPHPLCDNIKYLAGDYENFCTEAPEKDKKCYRAYMEALEKWHLSKYTHKKVDAIYRYLKKGCLIEDLVREKVISLNAEGQIDTEIKIQGITQEKAFVRFAVMENASEYSPEEIVNGDGAMECWKDQSLMECYILYCRTLETQKDLCYLSGNMEQITYLHAKKIRNEGDGAKLISANDDVNFTYRGRFTSKEQAFAIGMEESQKIHNALKWIIRKQGYTYDTMTIVAWQSQMKPMPMWDAGTDWICEEADALWGNTDDKNEEETDTERVDSSVLVNSNGAERFYQALDGYRKNLNGMSNMILMAFDAATTGRLAMLEYKHIESSQYLNNIQYWHTMCGWIQEKRKKGGTVRYFGIPGIRNIADILYGTEVNGNLTMPDKNRKKMYAELCRKMIPCIWNRAKVPIDIVNLAVNRASSPLSYKEKANWESTLTLACSLVKKQKQERNPKEVWTVALDNDCKDRSYLYGRLLAVADRVEQLTYDREGDANRITNAKRYMTAFSQRPCVIWKVIEEALQPYWPKLKVQQRIFYENLLGEIYDKFSVEEFENNDRLDSLYLLGMHSQAYELKHKKQTGTEEKNERIEGKD